MIRFTEAPILKARRRPALSDIEWEIRRLLLAAVGKVTDFTSTREIMRALEDGNFTEALQRVRFDLGEDFLRSTLPASIRDAYEAVGPVAAADTARLVGSGYSFSLITPRAVEWTASTAGSLIQQWGESSRDTIRRIIAQGFAAGDGAGVIARQIQQSGIGITWRSARAVLNMRQRMEADGKPASAIETQTTRYYNRLVRDRAEMIARTEMTRAMTHARLESWRQAMDRGLLDSTGYEKEWLATHDSRACDECLDLDGARASVPDGIFVGAGGTNGGIGPGQHPRCRCTVLLVEKGSARTARAQRNIQGDLGIRKYNPNHDELGRFASGDGGGGGGESADPLAAADQAYPKTQAGAKVGGLTVRGGPVDNTSSIEGEALPGVRVVQMSAVRGPEGWGGYRGYGYAAADDVAKVERLIEAIRVSGEISPLIVSISADGPYVLEGGHRASALAALGITEFPALVALEDDADLSHLKPRFLLDAGLIAQRNIPGDLGIR